MTMSRGALSAVLLAAALLCFGPRPAVALAMSWTLESRVDPATGDKSCKVISLGGDITAHLAPEGQEKTMTWSVMIGFDNQPGSVRYLRIDGKVFQNAEASFQGAEAVDIVARLVTPSPGLFLFEWIKGPDEVKRGGLYGPGNFATKASLCEAWLSGTST